MPTEPPEPDEEVVIEIGCGPANAGRVESQGSTIGVDIDLRALRTPGVVTSGRRYVCANALELPLRSSSCDLLVLEAVLHHLVPTDRAVRELARVLRSTGRVRITDGLALAPDDAAALDDELRAAGLPTEPTYGFDLDELAALIARAGLDVVDVRTGGVATFATPPFVSRTYSTERFTLIARATAA